MLQFEFTDYLIFSGPIVVQAFVFRLLFSSSPFKKWEREHFLRDDSISEIRISAFTLFFLSIIFLFLFHNESNFSLFTTDIAHLWVPNRERWKFGWFFFSFIRVSGQSNYDTFTTLVPRTDGVSCPARWVPLPLRVSPEIMHPLWCFSYKQWKT